MPLFPAFLVELGRLNWAMPMDFAEQSPRSKLEWIQICEASIGAVGVELVLELCLFFSLFCLLF